MSLKKTNLHEDWSADYVVVPHASHHAECLSMLREFGQGVGRPLLQQREHNKLVCKLSLAHRDLAAMAAARRVTAELIDHAQVVAKLVANQEVKVADQNSSLDRYPPPGRPASCAGFNISVKISPAPHELGALGVR